ncbi:MAG: carboxypeptidase regulatory-like domain-containing protein, partial [Bacteroidota bacterium]
MIRTFMLLLMGITSIAAAQQRIQSGQRSVGKITGQIIDTDTQRSLEYASVSIFSLPDSSLVTGGISDAQGKFTIETLPGRYYASVQFISYRERLIEDIVITRAKGMLNLGVILLKPDVATLSEV